MPGGRLIIWCLALVSLLLLFSLGRFHPFVFLLMGTVSPLPVLLVGWRLGERAALLLVLAAALSIFWLQGSLAVLLETLGFGELLLMGLLLGGLQFRRWPPAQSIILVVAILSLVLSLVFLGQAFVMKLSPVDLWSQKVNEVAETLNGVLGGAGLANQSLQVMGVSVENWRKVIKQVLPSLLVINTAFVAWINLVLARRLAPILGGEETGPPLWQWVTPEWLIFLFLGAGFLLLAPVTILRQVSLNCVIIFAFVYFCQGVAVVAAMFERFQVPRLLRLLGYPLLFLNPMLFLVIILGLMDLWLDFRRLHQPHDA